MRFRSARTHRLPSGRGATLYQRNGRRLRVAVEMPKRKANVVYHGTGGMIEIKDATVPDMVVIADHRREQGAEHLFFVPYNGGLYAWPGGNAWNEGRVCWGGNQQPHDFAEAVTTFFGSPFNRDLVQLHPPTQEELAAAINASPMPRKHKVYQFNAGDGSTLMRGDEMWDRWNAACSDLYSYRYSFSQRDRIITWLNDRLSRSNITDKMYEAYHMIRSHFLGFVNDIDSGRWTPTNAYWTQYHEARRPLARYSRATMHRGLQNVRPITAVSKYTFSRIVRAFKRRYPEYGFSTIWRTLYSMWYHSHQDRYQADAHRVWEKKKIIDLWKEGTWPTQVRGAAISTEWMTKAKTMPDFVEWYCPLTVTPGRSGRPADNDPMSKLYDAVFEKMKHRPTWKRYLEAHKTALDAVLQTPPHCPYCTSTAEVVMTYVFTSGHHANFACPKCRRPWSQYMHIPQRPPHATITALGWTGPGGITYAALDNGLYRWVEESKVWERVEIKVKRSRRKKHAVQ